MYKFKKLKENLKYINFNKEENYRGNWDYEEYFVLDTQPDYVFAPCANMTYKSWKSFVKKVAEAFNSSIIEQISQQKLNELIKDDKQLVGVDFFTDYNEKTDILTKYIYLKSENGKIFYKRKIKS
jgi:hypothetical protein